MAAVIEAIGGFGIDRICEDTAPYTIGSLSNETLYEKLARVNLRWKSIKSIVVDFSDPEECKNVHTEVLAADPKNLLRFCKALSEEAQIRADKRDVHYKVILQAVSMSVHHFLCLGDDVKASACVKLENPGISPEKIILKDILHFWLEDSDIIDIIHQIFNDSREDIAENKKLALDLGFVLLTNVLNFEDVTLGFLPPLTHSQCRTIFLMGKFLESFMVTAPTHYPFMPAEFFATIKWPVALRDTCSGKVHSIIDFLMPSFSAETDSNDGADGEVKYCNYEVVARKQPWKAKFSTMQLYRLAQLLLDSRSATIDHEGKSSIQYASAADCNEALMVLKLVFHRMASIDPSLLYRDKSKSVIFYEQTHCNVCDKALLPSMLERMDIFSKLFKGSKEPRERARSVASTDTASTSTSAFPQVSSTSKQAQEVPRDGMGISSKPAVRQDVGQPSQRHHCRLCFESICSSCSAEEKWMGERICSPCHQLLLAMDLQDVKEKPRRTFFNLVVGKRRPAQQETSPELTGQSKAAISLLNGESSTTAMEMEGKEESEWIEEDNEICCSMLLPPDLQRWRDADD